MSDRALIIVGGLAVLAASFLIVKGAKAASEAVAKGAQEIKDNVKEATSFVGDFLDPTSPTNGASRFAGSIARASSSNAAEYDTVGTLLYGAWNAADEATAALAGTVKDGQVFDAKLGTWRPLKVQKKPRAPKPAVDFKGGVTEIAPSPSFLDLSFPGAYE